MEIKDKKELLETLTTCHVAVPCDQKPCSNFSKNKEREWFIFWYVPYLNKVLYVFESLTVQW